MELPQGERIEGPVRLWIGAGSRGSTPFEVTIVPGGEVVLGSAAEEADPCAWTAPFVHVDDVTVSARHCRVTHAGSAVEVVDLGARNGVRVGGVRVPRAALPLGGTFEIGRTLARVQPAGASARVAASVSPLAGLVGASSPMRALAGAVRRVASLRLPVLLRGESGSGKDLVARAVHDESPRAAGPFVVLNAAAISRELAESELFGHKRGAFTGAMRDRRGAFREAHGGTLFLDEIGAVPLELQAKLLRAVESGVVRPVGAEADVPIDVRLVAATCEPLEAMVDARLFRGDLYERLAVCVVQVPPLRDRPEDIPALARHLLGVCELGDRTVSADAVAALRGHRWPGNVRELRNVLVQAAVAGGHVLGAEHVAAVLAERAGRARRVEPGEALRIFEETGRNVSAAARRADLPRTTMRDLLRSAGVEPWPRRRGPGRCEGVRGGSMPALRRGLRRVARRARRGARGGCVRARRARRGEEGVDLAPELGEVGVAVVARVGAADDPVAADGDERRHGVELHRAGEVARAVEPDRAREPGGLRELLGLGVPVLLVDGEDDEAALPPRGGRDVHQGPEHLARDGAPRGVEHEDVHLAALRAELEVRSVRELERLGGRREHGRLCAGRRDGDAAGPGEEGGDQRDQGRGESRSHRARAAYDDRAGPLP